MTDNITCHSEKSDRIYSESYDLKKCAFTLAEVLIAIAVIGIVASMTIPILNQRTNEKELVSSYLKLHSVLNNAYKETEAEKEYKIYGIQPDRFREYFENI